MTTIKASGANSVLYVAAETSYGVLPTTPVWYQIPFQTMDGELVLTDFADSTITGNRMERPIVPGTRATTFTIAVSYGPQSYAMLDSSAFCNVPASGVLTSGTSPQSMTIVWVQNDIDVITVFPGILVNKRSIKVPVKGVVTCQYDCVGTDATVVDTMPAGTVTPLVLPVPYAHTNANGSIQQDGASVGTWQDLQIDQDNQFTANDVLGSATPDGYTYGNSKVTITGTAYFVNATMFDNFKNNLHSQVDLKLANGTHSDELFMKDVKFNTFKPSVKNSGVVMVAFTGTAYGAADSSYSDLKQTSV